MLKIHLPLNGDLKNKGSSKLVITNGGATVNSAGKIGSCYSFDGSDDYISLQSQVLYDIFKGGTLPFSVAFWVYHADSTRAIIFGDYGLSGAISFNIELGTNHSVRFYWAGSPDKSFNSESYVAAAGWTHICLTYDGSKVLIYKDGILSSDNYNGTLATKSKTSGVYYLGRDSRTGSTVLNGRLNDFRIYDHCLSKQEVSEIARGLVLHYKLDGESILNGNPNLGNTSADYSNMNLNTLYNLSSWGGDAGTVIFYNSGGYNGLPYKVYHKTTTGSGGVYYKTANDITIEAGKTYTMSCWIKSSRNYSESAYAFNINRGSDNLYINYGLSLALTTEWKLFSKTFTATEGLAGLYGEMGIIYDDNVTDYYVYYSGFKIEEGDLVTSWTKPGSNISLIHDSSGYNNNGITNGTFNIDSSSAHYNISTIFNGSDNAILIPFNNLIHDEFTFTCWFYKTSIGSKSYQTLLGGPSGFELEARNGGGTEPQIVPWNWGKNLATYNFNEWTFIAFTRDVNQTLLYVNGEYKTTGTAGTLPTGNYYIGAWNTPTLQNFEGKMSDVRLYSTVLTAQQILDLYKNEASIDNKENIYARELVEE